MISKGLQFPGVDTASVAAIPRKIGPRAPPLLSEAHGRISRVPLDMNTLTALKRSSLGLDLYLWLAYRTFALMRPLRLSWRRLYRQFGADPAKATDRVTVDNFRKDCLRELKKIKTARPELNYRTAKGVLILSPSKPMIPPLARPRSLA